MKPTSSQSNSNSGTYSANGLDNGPPKMSSEKGGNVVSMNSMPGMVSSGYSSQGGMPMMNMPMGGMMPPMMQGSGMMPAQMQSQPYFSSMPMMSPQQQQMPMPQMSAYPMSMGFPAQFQSNAGMMSGGTGSFSGNGAYGGVVDMMYGMNGMSSPAGNGSFYDAPIAMNQLTNCSNKHCKRCGGSGRKE